LHGGRDLKEGQLDNMWRVNIDDLKGLQEDPYKPLSWELITHTSKGPGKISHHTCSIHGEKMILIGGL